MLHKLNLITYPLTKNQIFFTFYEKKFRLVNASRVFTYARTIIIDFMSLHPISNMDRSCTNDYKDEFEIKRMDPPGFEPGASALQGRRSPSLSYGPT